MIFLANVVITVVGLFVLSVAFALYKQVWPELRDLISWELRFRLFAVGMWLVKKARMPDLLETITEQAKQPLPPAPGGRL